MTKWFLNNNSKYFLQAFIQVLFEITMELYWALFLFINMFMKSVEVCYLENIPKHEFRNDFIKACIYW